MQKVNFARLKNCMRRAEKGERLTIGFFGGSITLGCAASEHEKCYAYRVFDWWRRTFPKADMTYVNGGIGGTDSHFGVSRVWQDLLMYEPDVVVLDFSVNDMTDDSARKESFFQETYEGLMRRILTSRSKPAVLILNNVYYSEGTNLQQQHNEIGAWYGIPHISMKDTLYKQMKAGHYTQEELTPDGLHPSDKGHELVAAQICYLLEEVKHHMEEKEQECGLPQPMTANAYENAKRLTIREASPVLAGFQIDADEKTGHLDVFKNGWMGRKAKDRIIFEEEASCIALQYRKSVAGPAHRANVILDGDTSHPWILDGKFEEDWGDSAQIAVILHHGERKKHRIEIEVMDGQPDGAVPFYLISMILG